MAIKNRKANNIKSSKKLKKNTCSEDRSPKASDSYMFGGLTILPLPFSVMGSFGGEDLPPFDTNDIFLTWDFLVLLANFLPE